MLIIKNNLIITRSILFGFLSRPAPGSVSYIRGVCRATCGKVTVCRLKVNSSSFKHGSIQRAARASDIVGSRVNMSKTTTKPTLFDLSDVNVYQLSLITHLTLPTNREV